MILLLGGTSETAPTAEALAAAGYRILVSTATQIPLDVGRHPGISHRRGRLPEAEMITLIHEKKMSAIVDVTHPYAAHVRATAARVAKTVGIPYVTMIRPGTLKEMQNWVESVPDHETAARIACAAGRPILLTIGSKNVAPYAQEGRRANLRVVARVLEHPDSIEACRKAGLPDAQIITGRGPFSIEENRELIRKFSIGVLVTKDSGEAGGVPEKLEAARLEGCRVIVVDRPVKPSADACADLATLLAEVLRQVPLMIEK